MTRVRWLPIVATMMTLLARKVLGAIGIGPGKYPPDIAKEHIALYERVRGFTATNLERIDALATAVDYILGNQIPGAIVECGVWRGGSMMAVADTLLRRGITDRDLYLFDTFSGMPRPESKDKDYDGVEASGYFKKTQVGENASDWCAASLEEVSRNVGSTGYPEGRVHLVKGLVEETIPKRAPDAIALLRLDTDWYSSTKHELIHLYPRLVPQGVLIIDDYGHWQGCREATDEYLKEHRIHRMLHRIDYTGRILVK